ncbi:ABC-type spermidine/putrescine transport system permease subunit I [Rhodoligotrophos appendicifer]|uniref:ABC transporter permease n=1 Tax=Rhodoligotrophos appendicifer TaxID=987056 RepID=UPI0011849D76|nr:ABC transporter permease subunit [Rhodoligotrophos appendicifer]
MFSLRWRVGAVILPFVFYVVFFLAPLSLSFFESLRTYVAGAIGSSANAPFTLENYIALLSPAYLGFLGHTFRLSLIATVLVLLASYPFAHHLARRPSGTTRKLMVSGLVLLLFMSTLVKVYSLSISLGPTGFGRPLAALLGTHPNSRMMSEIFVVLGLFGFLYPIATLMQIGTIQNINPRYLEAALALGANRLTSHFKVVLPLCIDGLIATFLVIFTLAISAFVIPMILGRGHITFITNLIYTRFSELANYPSGAALSMLMLVISLTMVFVFSGLLSRFVARRLKTVPET